MFDCRRRNMYLQMRGRGPRSNMSLCVSQQLIGERTSTGTGTGSISELVHFNYTGA